MELYYQALHPPALRLCGYHLRAYSSWSHTLLRALDSPFLSEDPDARITPGDLLLACRLASLPWRLDRHGRPRPPRLRPRLRDLAWRLWLTLRPAAFEKRAHWFHQWLQAHTRTPLLWKDPEKRGLGLTSPDTLGLVYALVAKVGLPEHRAWNLSLGLAQFITTAVAEIEGAQVTFADPDELENAPAPIQPTTRDQIYQTALRDLGPAGAAAFIRRYDQHHPQG